MSSLPPSSTTLQPQSHSQTETETKTATGQCTLLLFGPAQTYCSTESLTFTTPTTLTQIFAQVEERFPGFGTKVLRGSQVVVNLEYVEWEWQGEGKGQEESEGDVEVGGGDEVGVVPPVSAG